MAPLPRSVARRSWAGQLGLTAVVAKAEQILQCFQDRGALAARWYQQSESTLTAPKVGAALVINQSRVNQELVNCALGGQEDAASAQTFAIEPCASAGSLTYEGDGISYLYAGSHPDVCDVFQLHFDNLAASERRRMTVKVESIYRSISPKTEFCKVCQVLGHAFLPVPIPPAPLPKVCLRGLRKGEHSCRALGTTSF